MKHPHWKYGETSVFVEDISISNGLFCKLLFPSLHELMTKNQVQNFSVLKRSCCCHNSEKNNSVATCLYLNCDSNKNLNK